MKRSKARNFLERLMDYEDDVLRLMENEIVPFTNNRGENDIRMTKVQQKISAAFAQWMGRICFVGFAAIFRLAVKKDESKRGPEIVICR